MSCREYVSLKVGDWVTPHSEYGIKKLKLGHEYQVKSIGKLSGPWTEKEVVTSLEDKQGNIIAVKMDFSKLEKVKHVQPKATILLPHQRLEEGDICLAYKSAFGYTSLGDYVSTEEVEIRGYQNQDYVRVLTKDGQAWVIPVNAIAMVLYNKNEKVDEPINKGNSAHEEGPANKYMREIKPGVWVDVYDVLHAFVVTNPALQHLIKKALAVGQRGHKDASEDYQDIIDSSVRAKQLHEEWND